MTLEEIKDKALELIRMAAYGKDIRDEAKMLYEDYSSLDAKFHKGDEVWVLDQDYCFVNAVVQTVVSKSFDGTYWYWLMDKTGRNVGKWAEDRMFCTKDDLRDFLISVCEKNK